MALAVVLLLVVSGALATYLYDSTGTAISRLAFGACSWLAFFSLVAFVIVSVVGFGPLAIGLAAAILGAPLTLLLRPTIRARVGGDVRALGEMIRRPDGGRLGEALYGLLVVVGLWLVFERVLFELPDGLYTGYVNNLGDLPLHLQIIASFAVGQNYPPEHAAYLGTTFSYPYMADFLSATLVGLGASMRDALFIPNLVLGVALVAVVHRWTLELTGNRSAALIAPLIVLLSGGLGWLMVVDEARVGDLGIVGALTNLDHDLTILPDSIYRWGNAITTLLTTQRSLAFGLPVAVVIFTLLWRQLNNRQPVTAADGRPVRSAAPGSAGGRSMFVAGLLAGTLPLIHAHSFVVVMVTAFLFGLLFREWRDGRWRLWLLFVVPALAIALPQFLWSTLGSQADASSFIGLHLGWDRGDANPIWFWLANTGLFIPLLLGAFLVRDSRPLVSRTQALYYLPFALWFVLPNVLRLAPWVWDNIKVLFYWWVGSAPIVALLLAHLAQRSAAWRGVAAVLFVGLTLAGALDVWRVVSGGTAYREFDRNGMAMADLIRERTEPRAVILHAPTYNPPTFLTGRRSLLGYTGYIWAHGLDYTEREADIRRIYAGEQGAAEALERWSVDYVLVSPLERGMMTVDEEFLARWPIAGEIGEYTLYALP